MPLQRSSLGGRVIQAQPRPSRQGARAGNLHVCDEIGYNYKLAEALPEHLQAFTVVVPDGVFTPETADYFSDEIANNSKQGGVEMPAIRILSMSQFMARGEYAGVMTEKERAKWRERATLPHSSLRVVGCGDRAVHPQEQGAKSSAEGTALKAFRSIVISETVNV